MKNYYEILEVDIHASKEVIDKAFKVLAKKYHPDTQEENKKQWAEEQFKQLNEAYEILSDKTRREEYTKELEFDKNNELHSLILKNTNLEIQIEDLQAQLKTLQNTLNNPYSSNDVSSQIPYENKINSSANDYMPNSNSYYTETPYTSSKQTYYEPPTYYESYYHPIKNKFKNFIAFCITILIIIFVGFLLWKIPYTHNLIVKFYENNPIIQSIFDLFY